MNKTNKVICIVLAAIVLIAIGINYYLDNIHEEPIIEPMPEPIIKKEDRDFVDNEIIVSFKEDVTEEEKRDFINGITIINDYNVIGSNIYVLTLNRTFQTRSELNEYCSFIESNVFVEHCEANNIIKLDDCSKGPC